LPLSSTHCEPSRLALTFLTHCELSILVLTSSTHCEPSRLALPSAPLLLEIESVLPFLFGGGTIFDKSEIMIFNILMFLIILFFFIFFPHRIFLENS
jgi:hypothetical protein